MNIQNNEERKCGYCGTSCSHLISRGKIIQPAWYRDQNYGCLCRNCEARKIKTGSVIPLRYKKISAKSKLMQEANMALCGTCWTCKNVEIHFNHCRKQGEVELDNYTLVCKECGRKVIWKKPIKEFLTANMIPCDCEIAKFACVNENRANRTNFVAGQATILKAIAENPNKNYSEIAKMCGVSRQRVSQIRESARAYYEKKVMKNGQTQGQ